MPFYRLLNCIYYHNEQLYAVLDDVVTGTGSVLKKGTLVTMGKVFYNYYGYWQRLHDLNNVCYDIEPVQNRPVLVKVKGSDLKSLIEETMFLYKGKRYKCDIITDVWGYRFIRFEKIVHHVKKYPHTTVETVNMKVATAFKKGIVYGSIWVGLDLKAVTQMDEKGDWVLL